MKNTIGANTTGLAFGGMLGLWHFIWAVLVALGLAQPLLDTIFRLHMIQPPYAVLPFSASSAVGLVAMTFIVGYVIGWLFGVLWNSLQGK